ncbi:MAG TPA: aldehyde dehydrogenase family protein [Steroidobacteraceae bacterium]|nr:aldehyde dehydrogenase family protein [Steroidobacteraceae bacterium]
MNDVKLLIGGKIIQARSAATFERRNPVSGAVVTRSAAAAEADAIAAVDAAAAAFPGWSALGPGARRAKLNKAAPAAVFTRDLARGRSKAIASRQWTRAHNVIMP